MPKLTKTFCMFWPELGGANFIFAEYFFGQHFNKEISSRDFRVNFLLKYESKQLGNHNMNNL